MRRKPGNYGKVARVKRLCASTYGGKVERKENGGKRCERAGGGLEGQKVAAAEDHKQPGGGVASVPSEMNAVRNGEGGEGGRAPGKGEGTIPWAAFIYHSEMLTVMHEIDGVQSTKCPERA